MQSAPSNTAYHILQQLVVDVVVVVVVVVINVVYTHTDYLLRGVFNP